MLTANAVPTGNKMNPERLIETLLHPDTACLLTDSKRRLCSDPLPLGDGDDLIRCHIPNRFGFACRPAHVDSIDTRGLAETHVHAQIVLTKITRSRLHLARLRTPAGDHGHARAQPVAVAARPDNTNLE